MTIYLACAVTALAVGSIIVRKRGLNLTWFLGTAVIGVLLSAIVSPIWLAIEKNNNSTFNEFFNGVEIAATFDNKECYRDGWCLHTYDCDPYTVTETETYTDSDGKTQTRTVITTKYHSCPYSTQETDYDVETTLGSFNIASSLMTGEPYRAFTGIPGGQVTAPPEAWTAAKTRIDAGEPGGVSKKNTYKNYILASDNTILKKNASEVEDYLSKGLLTTRSTEVRNKYMVDKINFVGTEKLVDAKTVEKLQDDARRLAGRVGTELHGDVNLVLVDGKKSGNADVYTDALHAYWLDPSFKRDRLPKNSIVLVMGVEKYDGSKNEIAATEDAKAQDIEGDEKNSSTTNDPKLPIEVREPKDGEIVATWVRGFTGMPVGNEGLLQEFRNFKNVPVNDALVGGPLYNVKTGEFKPSKGLVESTLFGVNKFERVSMSGSDADDKGTGFAYLNSQYEMSKGGAIGSMILTIVIGVGFLALAYALSSRRALDYDPLVTWFSKDND